MTLLLCKASEIHPLRLVTQEETALEKNLYALLGVKVVVTAEVLWLTYL